MSPSFLVVACLLQGAAIQRDIPNATWEPIFFGEDSDLQTINGRAKLSGLPRLREKLLPKGVVEIRVWEGFGVTYLQGYRFKFNGGKWLAWKIEPAIANRKDLKERQYLTPLKKEPSGGWSAFWKTMDQYGLYTLPDFDSLPGQKENVLDGMSYVVEFQRNGKYRTYCYDNPMSQPKRWRELENILNITRLIHRTFDGQ